MISAAAWENRSALGGTRTPNLLIRSLVPDVRRIRWGLDVQLRVRRASSEDVSFRRRPTIL